MKQDELRDLIKGQIMKGLVEHGREFGYYSQWLGKLLTSFEHKSNMIWFAVLKNHSGCHVRKLEWKQKGLGSYCSCPR